MKLQFYQYQWPFGRTFETAKGSFAARRGLLVHLQKKGISAWGEAAPLPGYSRETFPELLAQVHTVASPMRALSRGSFLQDDIADFCRQYRLLPSLQFALFTLGCCWRAQLESKPLETRVNGKAAKIITLNAVVDLNRRHLTAQVDRAVSAGFETVKIKAKNTSSFINQLSRIRSNHPNISIRLDANQRWSFEAATDFLNGVEPLQIEYCEEPLHHPTAESLAKLKQETSVPLALDESLVSRLKLDQAAQMVPVLVIKPMLCGITENLQALRSLASSDTVKLVFSSSLESGIGRLMTAAMASAFGSKNTAHGLATGYRLQCDVWSDEPFINEGNYSLPSLDMLSQLLQIDVNSLQLKEIITE